MTAPTFTGRLVSIQVAPEKGVPPRALQEVRAVAGRGLEGDRHFSPEAVAVEPGSGREVTLIEREAVDAVASEEGVILEPAALQRNLVTEGVPLNHLVGRDFLVGEVRLRGVRLCEPCGYLQRLLDTPRLASMFLHRAGLRSEIVADGTLRAGDTIHPA